MSIEHRLKSLWRMSLVAVALAGACTKPNPQSCQDGTCTDPAFPFCDLDGALSGEDQTCIAVACTANEFVACRGDRAITCNTTGTDYELELCGGGCAEAAGGCRRCEPNETVCANGKLQTCDADGSVVNSETCAFGCFENEPRCRRLDPSNNLGMYLDLVVDPPDLDLENASFDTGTGIVTLQPSNTTTVVPSFLAQNGDGPSIRVFVANNVRLNNGAALSTTDQDRVSGAAFALVAKGTIKITGRFSANGTAGAVKSDSCRGGTGQYYEDDQRARASGSGGGGHATPGGKGGDIVGAYLGGARGEASGNDSLIPLRGGCPAGGMIISGDVTSSHLYGAPGGGAVQLSSQVSIEIEGIIDVRGASSFPEQTGSLGAAVYGGGAGGGILLEAPMVSLGTTAKLIAKGGAGASYTTSHVPDDTVNPDGDNYIGGHGAAPGIAATAGGSVANGAGDVIAAGGGGGGLGRIRINTRDSIYARSSTAVEAGMTTAGVVSTR